MSEQWDCGTDKGVGSDCHHGGGCGCGGHAGHFERRYQTKAEQVKGMEAYLDDLKNEVKAVEEHLTSLRK